MALKDLSKGEDPYGPAGHEPAPLVGCDLHAAGTAKEIKVRSSTRVGGQRQAEVRAGRPERIPVQMVVFLHARPTGGGEVDPAQTVLRAPANGLDRCFDV